MAMAAEDITAELKQDMATLRADLGSLMAAVKDLGQEQGRVAYDRLRETGQQAGFQAREAQESLEQVIETRPFTSVLVAFGTGFAIATLLGSRQ